MIYELDLCLPTGKRASLVLQAAGRGTGLARTDDGIRFDLPDDSHVYLSTTGDTAFARPPERSALELEPERAYALRGHCRLDGGKARLWVIEYDDASRLGHQSLDLADGAFALRWTTQARYDRCRVAVRLSGRGSLSLGDLRLEEAEDAEASETACPVSDLVTTGPAGHFRRCSIFEDPCDDRPYTAVHHAFYDQRDPRWYAEVIKPLAECQRVLDVGCGPGLLLEALRQAGVPNVFGLERDPHYLQRCAERSLPVVAHDLRKPFPFLATSSFDGVMAHQVLDYLSPISIRTLLREVHRVLRPGGLFRVHARTDGRASGDATRTVPLRPALLRRWLDAAGFDVEDVDERKQGVQLSARRDDAVRRFEGRTLELTTGQTIRPWQRGRAILPPGGDAWDNLSNRDFTLLCTSTKDEVRVAGKLVGYYTGYREQDGQVRRAIGRAISEDGVAWEREPGVPVLEAGPSNAWDDGGVAAGSVIDFGDEWEREGAPARYLMYYSGLDGDGVWGGIGLAVSLDGITWQRMPERVLPVEAYPGLKHLALADVIRTTAGRWLMHCEGWVEGRGWAVYQAEAEDGIDWQPTQLAAVLAAGQVPWGGTHVANPKCLELEPGHFVLGINAADDSLRFQLGLAESRDARDWNLLPANPVLCSTDDQYRIESFFLSRQAWASGKARVYYFRSQTRQTQHGSAILAAEADTRSAWLADERWHTERTGLYRVVDGRLCAWGGAGSRREALTRSVDLDREVQCSFRLGACGGRGAVAIEFVGDGVVCALTVQADGGVSLGGRRIVDAASETARVAAMLRASCCGSSQPEVETCIWHEDRRVYEGRFALTGAAERVDIRVGVPPGEPDLVVEHLDVWQPAPEPVTKAALLLRPRTSAGGGVLPEPETTTALSGLLDRADIGPVLARAASPARPVDDYDAMCELRDAHPDRLWPMLRTRHVEHDDAKCRQFDVRNLELLWQMERLGGLWVDPAADGRPTSDVLRWLERRQVLTGWELRDDGEVDWLEEHVLRAFRFPVIVWVAEAEAERSLRARVTELTTRHDQVVLALDAHRLDEDTLAFARQHARRCILASDVGNAGSVEPEALLSDAGLAADAHVWLASETLRFLTERAGWHRCRQLREVTDLMFPPPPASSQEVSAQGFHIIPEGQFADEEPGDAKTYWSEREVGVFYRRSQPWARMVAQMVADLGVRSVLEFGCGAGRNLWTIRQLVADVELTGIDVNPEAIRIGCENTDLDLRHADEGALGRFADGSFDLVFTVSVIDHIAEPASVMAELLRVAGRYAYFLEVTLPVEGKVIRHYDHKHERVCDSTEASYSWRIDRWLRDSRVLRVDRHPWYLHPASLGPYYWGYLAWLARPDSEATCKND